MSVSYNAKENKLKMMQDDAAFINMLITGLKKT